MSNMTEENEETADESRSFQEIVEDAGCETRSYSGRGMYGKRCLGIDVDRGASLGRILAGIIGSARDMGEVETVSRAFCSLQLDSMGTGSIAYFENVPYAA